MYILTIIFANKKKVKNKKLWQHYRTTSFQNFLTRNVPKKQSNPNIVIEMHMTIAILWGENVPILYECIEVILSHSYIHGLYSNQKSHRI